MNNNPIGIFDSGIGGLTILEEIRKLLPNEDIIYYADNKNNPYGSKSDIELFNITSKIVDFLTIKKCKIIVIACNTATTRCIKYLREKYPSIIFIGTEPAIKVACDKGFKNTLVLATPATISSKSIPKLIENKQNEQQIFLQQCDGLANAIETNNQSLTSSLLKQYLTQYQNNNIDAVVLGCTHYPYVKKEIQKYFPNAKIIDSSKGVAKETKRKLKINNLLSNSQTEGKVTIIKE